MRKNSLEFMSRLRDNEIGQKLFDNFPDVCFFLKDVKSRFVGANQLLLKKIGFTSEKEIIGLTDYDFWYEQAAESYQRDDAKVMRTGVPQINKHEIIASSNGMLEWYQTTKIPLHGKDGSVIGLIGFSRDLRLDNSSLQFYRTMEPVIQYILNNYSSPIRVSDLAKISGMTASSFVRQFKYEFQMTPSHYLTLVRLNAACRMLSGSQKSISTIAMNAGFYDHSYFTKQFVKHKKITPTDYRIKHEGQPQSFKRMS
jgi:AraC-like DNA-binding protein